MSTEERSCIAAIRAMKPDIDVILTQLRSGRYASPDTFVNNWAYLTEKLTEIKPLLSQAGVTDALLRTDIRLMADLLALVTAVEIMDNFMGTLAHHANQLKNQPDSPSHTSRGNLTTL